VLPLPHHRQYVNRYASPYHNRFEKTKNEKR
jgi:hypothetical protein